MKIFPALKSIYQKPRILTQRSKFN